MKLWLHVVTDSSPTELKWRNSLLKRQTRSSWFTIKQTRHHQPMQPKNQRTKEPIEERIAVTVAAARRGGQRSTVSESRRKANPPTQDEEKKNHQHQPSGNKVSFNPITDTNTTSAGVSHS
jgi:hypothetical protein